MQNDKKISVISLVLGMTMFLSTSCEEELPKEQKKNEIKQKIIELQLDTGNDELIEEKEVQLVDSIIILEMEENFSEVVLYYKSFIGKAYSRNEYDAYFELNRPHLDSLIKKIENTPAPY